LSKPEKWLVLYLTIVINRQNISVGVLGLVVTPFLSATEFLLVKLLLLSLQTKKFLENWVEKITAMHWLRPSSKQITDPQTHIQLSTSLFTSLSQ